jgi:hypothetical protein
VQQLGLGSFVQKVDSCVRVADGREVKLEGKIRMIIKFKDGRGDDVAAELDLLVLDGLTLSIVIGIRSILDHFVPLFMEMINGGGDEGTDQEAEENNRTVPDLNRLYTRDGPILGEEEVRQAKNPVESFVCHDAEESEEEMIVPEPCSFTAGRHFLGMS